MLLFESLFDEVLAEANPYHDRMGNFTSPEGIARDGAGSKSLQFSRKEFPQRAENPKWKFDKKLGKERLHAQWKAASRPCGRAARMQGADIPCFTKDKEFAQKRKEARLAAKRAESAARAGKPDADAKAKAAKAAKADVLSKAKGVFQRRKKTVPGYQTYGGG